MSKKPNSDASTTEPNENERQVSVASTCCHDCVFATFDNKIQTGCSADRLSLFKKHDIDIVEVEHDDLTSFIIDGKMCVYYRNKEWAHAAYTTSDPTVIYDTVKAELKIPYHVLLFFRTGDTIEDLTQRLSELHKQQVPPKMVTVVDRSHVHYREDDRNRQESAFTSEIMKLFHEEFNFAYWRMQTIQNVNELDVDVIDLVYDSTKSQKYMFYICFDCQYEIPQEMSEDIHKSLHDEMRAFILLQPNANGVGHGALKAAHAKHGGNSFSIPLETKLIHYEDAPHLIKKVEEICPSLRVS